MTGAKLLIDIVAAVLFIVATGLLAAAPSSKRVAFSPDTKAFMVAAFAVFAVVESVAVIGNATGSVRLASVEDSMIMLFPVLALLSSFSAAKQEQYLEAQAALRAAHKSQEMMMTIVESAPCGILAIDSDGWITFANDTARDVLDLFDVPERGQMDQPGWTAGRPGPDGMPREGSFTLEFLLRSDRPRTEPVVFRWPNGWRIEVRMAVSPLRDASDAIGGAIVTFEAPGA